MKSEVMKLYVWERVLKDYSYGVMFAYAVSAECARFCIVDKTAENYKLTHGFAHDLFVQVRAARERGETLEDLQNRLFEAGALDAGSMAEVFFDLCQEPREVTEPEGFYLVGGG